MSRTERSHPWRRCPGWPCSYCVEGKRFRQPFNRLLRRNVHHDAHLAKRDPEHPQEVFDGLRRANRR